MITDSDLRALFADEASDIGEPAELLARLTIDQSTPPAAATRRWRGWVAPVAAAAAVVTVASVAIAISGTRHQADAGAGSHTLPSMPGRELGYTISVGAVSGYITSSSYLLGDRETTEVILPGEDGVIAGEVVAYPRGGFDPTEVRRGRPVTVQGHPGYFGPSISSADQIDHLATPTRPLTLAWETAPDRWIAVQGWDATGTPALQRRHLDPFTEEMRVARAVDASTTRPLLLPYRVGYLPAGLRHGGGRATPSLEPGWDWDSYLWFVGAGQTGPAQSSRTTFSISARPAHGRVAVNGSLSVNGHPAQFFPHGHPATLPAQPSMPPTLTLTPSAKAGTQAQHPRLIPINRISYPASPIPHVGVGRPGPPDLVVDFGRVEVIITGAYSKDELLRVARSMTIARDVDNLSAWFDAAK
jgi:hypothetical protein